MLLSDRYRWTTKDVQIENVLNNGHIEDDRAVIICVEDKMKGIKFPHPITHFIKQIYAHKGTSINTQKNAAREICKFLNFINKQISSNEEEFMMLKEEGIPGLQPIHGARYITFLTNERDKDNKQKDYKYVKNIERYLTIFYKYLSDMDIIEDIEFVDHVDKLDRIIVETPFDDPKFGIQYPKRNDGEKIKYKLKDFGNETEKRDQMIVEFLRVAEVTCPEIAFGIGLQIFGGLRKGEVVNIMSSSLPTNFLNGENAIVIKDNQKTLFERLKSQGKQEVKRPRLQLFFANELLRDMYKSHLIRIDSQKNRRNMYAFFLNKDGEAISGESYEKKFAKVKRKYIEILRKTNGRYSDFKILDESIWGTHIGRGIFTNILFDLKIDEIQMAILRGDMSTLSSKEYIDKRNALAHFQSAMNGIYKTDSLSKTLSFEVK